MTDEVPVVPRPETYERARPIFDRTRRAFHPATRLLAVRTTGDAVDVDVATRDGVPLTVRITFPDPHVARLRWRFGGAPDEHVTEMLTGVPPRLPLTVDEGEDEVTVSAGGPPLVLDRTPWRVRFGAFRTEPADNSLVEPVAEAGGWAVADGAVQAYETWSLAPGEELFGLGERFLGPRLRGRRLAHWIDEPFGTNTTDRVYKSVPLVVSSAGYGVFVHQSQELTFDLGATSTVSASVLVDAPELDLFVVLGTPKEILGRYTALTGRAPVPPAWSFGVWMSKCMYANRDEVAEVLDRARQEDIPVEVVGLDPLWLAHRPGQPGDFCDFVWNDEAFGPMDEFLDWLHGQDVRLCLWVNPHLLDHLDAYLPERLVDGGRARDPWQPRRGYVDLTAGAGRQWWRDELSRLVAAGVDAVKLDYGELLPATSTMADGRSGAEVHNLYPLLASMLAAQAGVPLAFTRAGTAGSQRYPLHWSGDAQSTWAGMYGALRGGLAAAWSGFAHWTTDIGGFFVRLLDVPGDPEFGFRRPEPELFVRWMQFGMLTSHTRFHGTKGREPWLYGDDAVRVAREFARLRGRLRRYLLDCSEEAFAAGVPVLRPLAMEFPDDPTCRGVDTGYLLGPGLLVYPVLAPGGRVEVYLPPGEWTEHFTGETVSGPRWLQREVPLDRLPLYVRSGHNPFD